MSLLFVVLVTQLNKKTKETPIARFWDKMHKRLQTGKAELLYSCTDTSADSLIRHHAALSADFKTYILLPVDQKKDKPLIDTVGYSLKKSLKKVVLEATDRYEVIVNQ